MRVLATNARIFLISAFVAISEKYGKRLPADLSIYSNCAKCGQLQQLLYRISPNLVYSRRCMNEEIQKIESEDAAAMPDASLESSAEVEQLRRENEELKQAARMKAAHDNLTQKLADAGARSPELLFDTVRGKIQFDEGGEPLNTAALVADLRSKFPEQFGATHASASIDAAAGAGARPNFLTAEALAKMTPQEIARLDWNEVRSVLTNN